MRLRNSFWALLGQSSPTAPKAVVERARRAIFAALMAHLGQDGQELKQQVYLACDLESLWYLRLEIMNTIAARKGEAVALDCLAELTTFFRGHHPGASSSRLVASPAHVHQGALEA